MFWQNNHVRHTHWQMDYVSIPAYCVIEEWDPNRSQSLEVNVGMIANETDRRIMCLLLQQDSVDGRCVIKELATCQWLPIIVW